MNGHRRTYTAVPIPWNGSWDVVILDPAGEVVTRSSVEREADVERAGRAALRALLRPGAASVELRVATARGR